MVVSESDTLEYDENLRKEEQLSSHLLYLPVADFGCQGGNRPAYDSEIRALPLNTRVTTPELINRDAMIPFEHALPSQNLDGRHNGTYNNVELAIPGVLTTSDTDLGMMMKWLRDNVWSGRHTVFVDGEAIPVYKNWIRDHVHTMKAFRHWEYNLRAYLDFTLAHQRPDGSFYELIKQMDDSHCSAEREAGRFPGNPGRRKPLCRFLRREPCRQR